MLTILIITSIITAIGASYFGAFAAGEGKDERGQAILAKSAQIVFSIVLLGFAFSSIYLRFADPNVEQMQILLHTGMAFVWFVNTISIIMMKRRS